MTIKDSGWIRSNHRVEIEVADDQRWANLICPPCCPSVANEHLTFSEPRDLGWRYTPLGFHFSDLNSPVWQCMARYEQENVGLLDLFTTSDKSSVAITNTLDESSVAIIEALPEGLYEFEIEFGASYGWTESTWIAPAEYEWDFYWRIIEPNKEGQHGD